jgi:hypothetical protein
VWFDDVEEKIRKKNKLFFSKDSECLQKLSVSIEGQDRRTVILWAMDCARETLATCESMRPSESRPRICLETCEAWARGTVKMPAARRAILDLHALAGASDDRVYSALCRAIGHAGATVHTPKHALGLPIYELTALVLAKGSEEYREEVSRRIVFYEERLDHWSKRMGQIDRTWAPFL